MAEQPGELAVVLYVEDDGAWRPSQVFTRRWIRFVDGSDGWSYDLFDGSWCRRDQRLHLYKSGGGDPYVNGFVDPGIHGRLWMLDGESVHDGGKSHPRRKGPMGSHRAPALTDADLLAMGIERTYEHPGDLFADASDEPTTYCEACDDEIPRHAEPCEHLCTCDHCGATYKSEGDEEDRCPDCNTSQLECEECGECGGETCISCGRNLCGPCWPEHADEVGEPCERGRPNWKEPE